MTANVLKSRESQLKFEWSFKPIILLLDLFGIQLRVSSFRRSSIVRGTLISIGILMLLTNILINHVSFVYIFTKNLAGRSSKPKGTAAFLNTVFGISVKVILSMGIHLVFMIYSFTSTWKDLWDLLLEIQKEMKLPASFYKDCRKHCYFLLLLLILVGKINDLIIRQHAIMTRDLIY